MLKQVDTERKVHSQNTSKQHKAILGQYLTPISIAQYMSSLLDFKGFTEVAILDPGSGQGALSLAAVESIRKKGYSKKISVDSFEIDKLIIKELQKNLEAAKRIYNVEYEIFEEDFIQSSVNNINWNIQKKYTHIIMNPPYKKMSTRSLSHKLLEEVGINTVNLYSAFVWLALKMVQPNGQVVAIIPRSFCNGVYYKPFREFVKKNIAIEHIHVFESRTDAFSDDSVLQENIIICFRNKPKQEKSIVVSWSKDSLMIDYQEKIVRETDVIKNNDKQVYFHVPIGSTRSEKLRIDTPFSDLGLSVSTGPIVDFRMRELLEDEPIDNSIPLLYPVHFKNYKIVWPQRGKKPNAIILDDYVKKNLFHNGNYVVIRRFSSKEENHRVIASFIRKNDLADDYYTFENHLNVIHKEREGIDLHLALGLICYLNSDFLDIEFRKFSGHTQVNVSDIKNLLYPAIDDLVKIGIYMESNANWENFDMILKGII